MDVVRLNFSHGNLAEHQKRIDLVRELNKKYRRSVKILGDLEGYRVRIGRLKEGKGVFLKKGQTVILTKRKIMGEGNILPFDYQGPLKQIKKGELVFIDDGNIVLTVEGHLADALKTRAYVGGTVKPGKGINIPGVRLTFRGIPSKDLEDLAFCLRNKIDFVAQSFVRDHRDIINLCKHIPPSGFQPGIIAKIEDRDGVRNLDRILRFSAGAIVARGDLGVSVPLWEVPILQKQIIRRCNRAGKIVMTATQMLESMTEHPRPTRAEVSDVANAILDGTDYVMLSGETAVGLNPAHCVDIMNQIIKFTEQYRNRLK